MKHLVLNADDFGLDPAVNAAIARAHTAGSLTSASLLVTAPHAAAAVAFAKAHPRLGVGIHLCLVQGTATDGSPLPTSPFALSAQLTLSGRRRDFIAAELRAQVERFLATGLTPTHLDTHQHTHIDPRVQRIVARLAREHGIAFVRAPIEPLMPALRCSRQRLFRKLARALVFTTFGAQTKRALRRAGLHTVDRVAGVLDPGHLTEPFVSAYLEALPEGLTEIFFHPATSATAIPRPGQSDYENATELETLCSPGLRQKIDQLGICLTNFQSLSAEFVF